MKINVNSIARRVEVDNRIPLHYYYRIADNLLKQANVYREENNIVDLYIILLRFSSLVSETIPFHRDYQLLRPKERSIYRKKLFDVIPELESLKPEFQRRVDELNEADAGSQKSQMLEFDNSERTAYASRTLPLEWPFTSRSSYSGTDKKTDSLASSSLWKYQNDQTQSSSLNTMRVDKQFQKLSVSLPVPKKETLSRHSILGPNGLQGQWLGPSAEIKVQYPCSADFNPAEELSLNHAGQYDHMAVKDNDHMAVKDNDQGSPRSTMDSVLSLDDGTWSRPAEQSWPALATEAMEDPFQFVSIKQPAPPPVLAQVRQGVAPIPPSQVADPRPGPAKSLQHSESSYQNLHVPVNMMQDFLRLAQKNTAKNLETCGVLAGSLKNRVFHITTLIIPKQESTSDSCQTLNEEEIFEVQDRLSLFPLGWIHLILPVNREGILRAIVSGDAYAQFITHPSQTCFMSSVDLHTHYSYQIMLPEAVAIVMAPTDSSSPHGIFHLSDPGGVNVIRNCQERGFHPHEEPSDGSPIYEHCSHVYMNSKLKFEVVDLR